MQQGKNKQEKQHLLSSSSNGQAENAIEKGIYARLVKHQLAKQANLIEDDSQTKDKGPSDVIDNLL